MQAQTTAKDADTAILENLNTGYMNSVQMSDVAWFEQNLGEDFLNSNPDGSLVDRRGFIEQIAKPATIANFTARDVRIRILGDVAIIHGRTTYIKSDGQAAAGRYTDVWARRNQRWVCVAAQVMRG